jgi:CRP-like cAMP-binding protein
MPSGPHDEALRSVPLFAGAEPDDLAAIAAIAAEVEFPAGRVIVRQGDPANGLFLIVSGGVHVVSDGETVASLGSGEVFGELAVLDRGPRVASVVADSPTRCLAVAAWDAERLLLERPTLAVAVARTLAVRLRKRAEDHHH